MDWSENDNELPEQVREAFTQLGFEGFPENEEQLKAYNEMFKDYPYKLTGKEIDPMKLIGEIEPESGQQWCNCTPCSNQCTNAVNCLLHPKN